MNIDDLKGRDIIVSDNCQDTLSESILGQSGFTGAKQLGMSTKLLRKSAKWQVSGTLLSENYICHVKGLSHLPIRPSPLLKI